MIKYAKWLALAAIVSTVGVGFNGYFNLHFPLKKCIEGALSAGSGWLVVVLLYIVLAFFWDKAAAKDDIQKSKLKK